MKQEVIITSKTVEAAVAQGAEQLGVDTASVTYEVLESPKKGFLGIGEIPAKVKVSCIAPPDKAGAEFLRTVLRDLNIEADFEIEPIPDAKREFSINITGRDAGMLIGHHGETLEALQYLVNLVANRRDEDEEEERSGVYTRFILDIANYRSKREETLTRLAKRTAEKALKYRRNISLEPMSAYERRIIHSALQKVEGVTTGSVGEDNNRKVVVYVENAVSGRGVKGNDRRGKFPHKSSRNDSPRKTAAFPEEEDIDGATAENISYYSQHASEPKNTKVQKRARFDETLPEYHSGDALRDGFDMQDVASDIETEGENI